MAWYNPATWTIVDNIQGQNRAPSAVQSVPKGDPNKIVGYVNGKGYNYAGDFIGGSEFRATAGESDWAKEQRAITAAIAAASRQRAYQPKLPAFDINANLNTAKTRAEQSLRPMYDQAWGNYMNLYNTQVANKNQSATYQREGVEQARTYTREDNATSRTRAAEDHAGAIQQLDTQEGQFQTDEGREFDIARRALQEQTAASGLTTSGLGQQAIGDQLSQRNVASERQTAEFDQQRDLKTLLKERTFEDLFRGDLRADEKATYENKGIQLDLDTYLSEAAAQMQKDRFAHEEKYVADVAGEAKMLAEQQIRDWLTGLAQSGRDARDIQYASQVYL